MINAGDWGLGVRTRVWERMKGNSQLTLDTDVAVLRLYFILHTSNFILILAHLDLRKASLS